MSLSSLTHTLDFLLVAVGLAEAVVIPSLTFYFFRRRNHDEKNF